MSSDAPAGTRGLPPPLLIFGEALQAIALGILEKGDDNSSFTTRAVGTIILALVLLTGSVVASFASPLSEGLVSSALTVPVVRADLIFLLLSRIVHVFIWASKLRPNKILYANEVFPIQAAAIIWNDCKPIAPHSRGEDGHSMIVDILASQTQLWQPTQLDTRFARLAKLPAFVILQVVYWGVRALEFGIFGLWRLVLDRGMVNYTPVDMQGAPRRVVGHTALLSDVQLMHAQELTMSDNSDLEQKRQVRRVLVRALHVANLLGHGGHTRLHEHAAGGHAMSEYYSAIRENELIKQLLSMTSKLRILDALPSGNKLVCGEPVPRQVMWARLVVGSMKGLQGEGRWRGPVASAVFKVARENVEHWGASVSRTALHRHVYSVSRRWLVDWIMFMWWEIDVPSGIVSDPDELFTLLQSLLTSNTVHNSSSLPHAVGELALSTARAPDINAMAHGLLGAHWEAWLRSARVAQGAPLADAMAASGEWKCAGRGVDAGVSVDAALYAQAPLRDVLARGADRTLGEQARARLAARIVATLTARVKAHWLQLPYRLLDPRAAAYDGEDV